MLKHLRLYATQKQRQLSLIDIADRFLAIERYFYELDEDSTISNLL